jgi:hypothetical protein
MRHNGQRLTANKQLVKKKGAVEWWVDGGDADAGRNVMG